MRHALAVATFVLVAGCATERVVFGTLDPTADGVASSDALADGSDASATDLCPALVNAHDFRKLDPLLASLEGYWRICGGTPMWDAPSGTIGITILAAGVYFEAPGPSGQIVLDPASRRQLGVKDLAAGVLSYAAVDDVDTIDVLLASDNNALTFHDRRTNATVAFTRTSSSFR